MANDTIGNSENFGSIPGDRQMYTSDDVDYLLKSHIKAISELPTASEEYKDLYYLLTELQIPYTKGHLYKCVEDKTTDPYTYSWTDMNIGRLAVGNCSNIALIRRGSTVLIRWTDPDDTTDSHGVILVKWAKTVLVRNELHEPTSVEDGTVVLTEVTRNQYSSSMFSDNSLDEEHETYYYKLFPMSEDGYVTNDSENAVEATDTLTWAVLKLMIETGVYKDFLPVGSIISLPDHDDYGEIEAEVVGYEDCVELVDESKTKAIVLQTRYLLTSGKQFDASESYAVITSDTTFQSGKRYAVQYVYTTDTEAVSGTTYYQRNSDWSYTEYAIEPGTVIESNTLWVKTGSTTYTRVSDMTLGDAIPENTYFELNVDTSRSSYGSNRWDHSAARKYLNATEAKGEWWTPSTIWDKQPSYATSLVGFLGGFHDSDFLSLIAEVKNRNALSSADGAGYVDTVDKVWLPSKYQLGGDSLNNGIQENLCPLTKYKDATAADRIKMYKTSSSGQYYFCRSAYTGISCNVWVVLTFGSFDGDFAHYSDGFAPCLVIA